MLFWFLTLFLYLPLGSFLLVSLGLVGYAFWPVDLDDYVKPAFNTNVPHVIVISHGMGDNPGTWSDELRTTLAASKSDTQVISLDWSAHAESPIRCSVDGRRIGKAVGAQLAAIPNLASLHLIAHSCGAFVNLGICESLRSQKPKVSVQTTYLDPVTVYGGVRWNFGLEQFGSCADFSDAYIDTADSVPGSNQLLPATHTFDVTAVRKCSGFNGNPHLWPTVYYRRATEGGMTIDLRTDPSITDAYPSATLTTVTESELCSSW